MVRRGRRASARIVVLVIVTCAWGGALFALGVQHGPYCQPPPPPLHDTCCAAGFPGEESFRLTAQSGHARCANKRRKEKVSIFKQTRTYLFSTSPHVQFWLFFLCLLVSLFHGPPLSERPRNPASRPNHRTMKHCYRLLRLVGIECFSRERSEDSEGITVVGEGGGGGEGGREVKRDVGGQHTPPFLVPALSVVGVVSGGGGGVQNMLFVRYGADTNYRTTFFFFFLSSSFFISFFFRFVFLLLLFGVLLLCFFLFCTCFLLGDFLVVAFFSVAFPFRCMSLFSFASLTGSLQRKGPSFLFLRCALLWFKNSEETKTKKR